MFPHPWTTTEDSTLSRTAVSFSVELRKPASCLTPHGWESPGYYYSSPVAADQRVYIASEEGAVVVLDAGEKFNVLVTNKSDGTILATPALVDGNIYVRTDNRFMLLGK